jgi:hypothetical protein
MAMVARTSQAESHVELNTSNMGSDCFFAKRSAVGSEYRVSFGCDLTNRGALSRQTLACHKILTIKTIIVSKHTS